MLAARDYVQLGKLPEEQLCRLVVCCRRELRRVEVAKIVSFSVRHYACDPPTPFLYEINSLKTTRICSGNLAILHVLAVCCQPQVRSAIVECITIDMINFHASWRVQDKSMHADLGTGYVVIMHGVKLSVACLCAPFEM